jgi:hypothetical protein
MDPLVQAVEVRLRDKQHHDPDGFDRRISIATGLTAAATVGAVVDDLSARSESRNTLNAEMRKSAAIMPPTTMSGQAEDNT